MKERLKKIYYCDFCKKHRMMINAMEKHEDSCTLNPNRVCRVEDCDGDCPWCEFSKMRIKGTLPPEYTDVNEQMKEWWDKKNNEEIMRDLY